MKKHIPNIITAGNAFMGTLAIVFVLENKPFNVILCILFALLFDFMDGLVARALNVTSAIGKELDSLADMVTFGVLPGIMMYSVLSNKLYQNGTCSNAILSSPYIPYIGFILTVFSAFRLAKFNVSEEQNYNFKGIPTPITALFIAGIYYNSFQHEGLISFIYCPNRLIILTALSSALLISNDSFIAFKFKKDQKITELLPELSLIVIGITLLVVTKWESMVYIYIIYILVSYLKFNVLSNK